MRFNTLLQELSLRSRLAIQLRRIVKQTFSFQSRFASRWLLTSFFAALAAAALFGLFGLIRNTHAAFATTYFVRTDGSDTLCNGLTNASAAAAPNCAFLTIGKAVATSAAGDTINVGAGTYVENPAINKALTLQGANAGIAGTGVRGAESIVRTNGNQTAVIGVTAANITINGFTIDGDDPGVAGSPLFSGDDSNVQYGVRPTTAAANNLTVNNNIIKRVFIGLRGDVASQGNVITRNLFDSIGNFDFGYAVSIRNDFYADVTNNKMTRSWTGIHINNHNGAGGPASFLITGNEIHAYAGGILYWLQFNGATGATISGNTITAEPTAIANNFGVLIVTNQDAVNSTFTSNAISGHDYGVGLFNVPTSSTITLGATNSISGSKLAGVFLTDNLNFNPVGTTNFLAGGPGAASTVNVTGLSIAGNVNTGVKVEGLTNTQTLNLNSASSISGGVTGLLLTGTKTALTGNTLNNTAFTGQSGNYIALANTALDNLTINATAVSFDGLTGATATTTQNFAIENKLFHALDDPSLGLINFAANTLFASSTGASGTTPTATNNDYTRINNAVLAATSGATIKLNGTFNWTEVNAAASWVKGSNGVAGDIDDYSVYPPANLNNVTFTANALGDATIQGPGDLAAIDLEGVFFFDGGDNQNWTISNIRFLDFDNAIGMFSGAGGSDAFNGTKILNNYIRLATDLDSSVAPNDVSQNIAIHLSFGTNQMVSGNTIEIPGNGVRVNDAAEVVLQSNTSGGNIYDGLQITNNTIRVLQAQSAQPEVVIGIWDNCHAHSSNITISGNSFTNLAGGNNPATNLQRGFRVTSHSSATTTVKYQNNTVSGANIGFQWRFGPFTGNQPVQLISNTITGNNTGVDVAEDGVALLKFNRIVGNLAAGVSGNSVTQILAENNWWGCNFGPGATGAGCSGTTNGASNAGAGGIDFNPWLVLGLTPTPSTVAVGGMSALTASLKKNSDNVDTSLMGMGLFPDGVTVNFTGTLGTVLPTPVPTSGAMANSIYTAGGTPGAGSASSMMDGQTVTQPITVTVGPLAMLSFVQQPTDTLINGVITPAVTVQAKDAFNNNISGASVTLTLSMGTGTLSGTLTQMTNGSGIATFNNLSLDTAGTNKKLTATSGAITAVSNPFTILPIPTTVYVDDNWVGLTPGTDPDGGGPATSIGYDAFATIQGGINAVANPGTVNVAPGSYPENVTVNKNVNLKGAQQGVNACGRSASESTITAAGTLMTLVAGSAGSIINGFTFSGGNRGIESTSGPLNNVQILNNRFVGFTGSGVFLNDPGTDITVSQNSIDGASKTGSGDLFHLDTDAFPGFWFTNNCINGKGATDTSSGFFVDGNHNVSVSATPRTPLIGGNTISNCQTGMNLGTRAFTGTAATNNGTISGNTFSSNLFDGLQGGIQNTTISGNTFSNNGRHGLALTSFGNTGADRGGQNTLVKGNLMSGNGFAQAGAGLFFSGTQAVGTIGTNHANFNRIVGNNVGAQYGGSVSAGNNATIDVENNWWGCNYGPGTSGAGCVGTVNGAVVFAGNSGVLDSNPWLTLNLMAMPPVVAQGGSSTLASKLTINSNNVDTAPMSMFVPNGTPATFTQGALGSVAPPNATTTNGVANSTYTAGSTPGNDSVSTTIDGQTMATGLTVGCQTITIAPGSLAGGTAGLAYPNTQLTATGGFGPHVFSIMSGGLPTGLMLSMTGLISGTPLQVGTFSFVVKATDTGGCFGTQSYTLVIVCPTVSLSPATLPNATINTAYAQTISASPAGGNYTFAVTSGVLPAGLTLNANGSFSGAPTQGGTFNFRVTATGFGGCTGFRDYTLVVLCPA
ncbi:MAG: putative Ig domain-containing protein, partial [Acidobacteria bacterium]|nr:putative Ig domain-containing protein [Acidobacteriota bacterium]